MSTDKTDLIAKLRTALERATPGPFVSDEIDRGINTIFEIVGPFYRKSGVSGRSVLCTVYYPPDAELIVLLRNHAAELLDRVEAAERERDELRAELARCGSTVAELEERNGDLSAECERLRRARENCTCCGDGIIPEDTLCETCAGSYTHYTDMASCDEHYDDHVTLLGDEP